MSSKRKYILTIGGFDPSGGAGVLADIKTFEQHRLVGMAVNTANTVQTENRFESVNWLPKGLILEQLDLLLQQYRFDYLKIGLIPSIDLIPEIHERVQSNGTKLIWDPILKASAGFNMAHEKSNLEEALKCLHFVTPNWEEILWLSNADDPISGAETLSKTCNVYLKGGHNKQDPGRDFVFWNGKMYPLRPKAKRATAKHGSGCVLSSALAANLTKGHPVLKSCLKAKEYATDVLESNTTLLGYHKK